MNLMEVHNSLADVVILVDTFFGAAMSPTIASTNPAVATSSFIALCHRILQQGTRAVQPSESRAVRRLSWVYPGGRFPAHDEWDRRYHDRRRLPSDR
jgi:hypothetical protein